MNLLASVSLEPTTVKFPCCSFDKALPKNSDISDNETEMIKQDDAYLVSTYALRTIGVVNRGLLCYIENGMLNDTIVALQEERIASSQMQSSVVFDITATATIDLR